MSNVLVIGVSVFAIIGIVCVCSMMISIYNGLINLRNQVDRAWANIDVILEQRHEEIPKLVSVCEQFATYERSTLDRLITARQNYLSAPNTAAKVEAANDVSTQLHGVLAIGEAYPQLQSSVQFVQLQNRISALESQIADRKELFNDTVTNFNVRCQQFPDSLVTGFLAYSTMQLYRVSEQAKVAPSVRLKLPA